jgi:hypothetical protein
MQMLGFSLMAGGMLALGAFTAPVVFSHFPRQEAGPVMALIFRRYDVVLLVALGLVLIGEALRWASKQFAFKSWLAWLRAVLLAGLTAGLLYSTLSVNASIEQMNKAGWHRGYTTAQGRQFEAAHKLSESLYKLELLMVVLLILITPFAGGVRPNVLQSTGSSEHELDSGHA